MVSTKPAINRELKSMKSTSKTTCLKADHRAREKAYARTVWAIKNDFVDSFGTFLKQILLIQKDDTYQNIVSDIEEKVEEGMDVRKAVKRVLPKHIREPFRIRRKCTVCPRKNRYGEIRGHVWKCVSHIFWFWFDMSSILGSLFRKIFCLNHIILENTYKNQNLELFAECRWFPPLFRHSRCSFLHLWPPAGVAKISITDRS